MSTVLVVDALSRHQRQRPGAPVRIADVAERLDVAPSTASRLVDRAAKAGMLVRDADPADSRRAAPVLSPASDALCERALNFRIGYLERVLTGWAATDIETLAGLMDRFAEAVHHHGLPIGKDTLMNVAYSAQPVVPGACWSQNYWSAVTT